MNLTNDFKSRVVTELLTVREKYSGADAAFARQWGINESVFSTLKTRHKDGKPFDGLVRDVQWLNLGRELNVSPTERKWNIAETYVFREIRDQVIFCKENAKANMLADDCAIGKTFTAKYLSKTIENCFYIDCSQCTGVRDFIRTFAKAIGVEAVGKYSEIKANIKYYLRMLPNPVVILDEAGDLEYRTFLMLKEFWNATDGACGWYMMGADGLRNKIQRGIKSQKVGYREIFSRYSNKYRRIVPGDKQAKDAFYRQLFTDVLSANCSNKALVSKMVLQCLATDGDGETGGLRRAESLLILETQTKAA